MVIVINSLKLRRTLLTMVLSKLLYVYIDGKLYAIIYNWNLMAKVVNHTCTDCICRMVDTLLTINNLW